MIVFELTNTENNPVYRSLEIANGNRQYDFLRSIVAAAIEAQRPFLSQHILKALNFHAITCLHAYAGEYRPCQVVVGDYEPPAFYRVQALMDDFVNIVNRTWEQADPVALAAFVLWRLNHIHPFINGNGRTARAACYFVLCVKAGGWLQGGSILPELIRRDHDEYVQCIRLVDASYNAGNLDLTPLHEYLSRLLNEQLASADAEVQPQPAEMAAAPPPTGPESPPPPAPA